MTPQSSTPFLTIERLCVSYGKAPAVSDVTVAAAQGQVVAIIGPNGAGKTTLLGAAMGLLKSSGTIIYDGANITRLDVEERLEAGLCLVPEKRELFGKLTVADNLLLGSYARRRDRIWVQDNLAIVYDRFPDLQKGAAKLRLLCLAGSGRCWRSVAL